MKPRNKIEREVAELSNKLPLLTREIEWGKFHLFSHEAFKCKDELWCSDCGHKWINSDFSELSVTLGIGEKTECPYCHKELTVKVSRKQKSNEIVYMTVVTVCEDYQVLRHVYCNRFTRKRDSFQNYFFDEVVQEWISIDGKRTIMAKPMNMGSSGWLYSHPLSIKNEYGNSYYYGDRYSFWGDIYPGIHLLPVLKKRGLKNSFHNVSPSMLIRGLLSGDNDYELCLKTKQYSMLQYIHKAGSFNIQYKPSFNICNRNKYKIKDASMWCDYIDLLNYFKLDVHNSKYVCPNNLKKQHDILMNRKEKIQAKIRAERQREQAIKDAISRKKTISDFYKTKMKFFGMVITDGNITIKPLESVVQYFQEAKAMHHCVFSNEYYKRADALILSARIEDKRVETIEVNLKTLQVVQSRGVCNKSTEYHDRIVNLVKKNIDIIRQKMTA